MRSQSRLIHLYHTFCHNIEQNAFYKVVWTQWTVTHRRATVSNYLLLHIFTMLSTLTRSWPKTQKRWDPKLYLLSLCLSSSSANVRGPLTRFTSTTPLDADGSLLSKSTKAHNSLLGISICQMGLAKLVSTCGLQHQHFTSRKLWLSATNKMWGKTMTNLPKGRNALEKETRPVKCVKYNRI